MRSAAGGERDGKIHLLMPLQRREQLSRLRLPELDRLIPPRSRQELPVRGKCDPVNDFAIPGEQEKCIASHRDPNPSRAVDAARRHGVTGNMSVKREKHPAGAGLSQPGDGVVFRDRKGLA